MGSEKKQPLDSLTYDGLINIANHLQADVEKQIKPHKLVFEQTKGGSISHYKVPDGKPKVIAWVYAYRRGRGKDTPRKPCLGIGIVGKLLSRTDRSVSTKLDWKPNANWGKRGCGEWQGVTYKINDKGYQLLLYALTMAAKECLRRAGYTLQ